MDSTGALYTIGHSNHTVADFIALLRQHAITTIVDVRSQPYSQWADQFNQELLQHDLAEAGIAYVFMGDTLGGRPPDQALYTAGHERPDYEKMATTPGYQQGIQRLLELAADRSVGIMCSEGDYKECHRHLLITQTLVADGVRVRHIRPDSSCAEGALEPQQLSLFG
ncbi:MAG: DUF488 domain-containing protein [Anaerolineae bacterium]|nr:DUF488 domain-containing protein [Anaerolineae bacterium]